MISLSCSPLRRVLASAAMIALLAPPPHALAQRAGPPQASTEPTSQPSPPWPRFISADGLDITIYQPQVDRWINDTLEARAAISIENKATPDPTLGVIWLTAKTKVDREANLVELDGLAISRASFPADQARADDHLAAIRKNLPGAVSTVSLSRIQASLAVSEAEAGATTAVPVKNDPPRIIVSETPALLILIDGKPVMRPVPGTNLLRAINTRALIVLDQASGRYYLRALKGWSQSGSLEGPWVATTRPPARLAAALKSAGPKADLMNDAPDDITDAVGQGIRPTIYVSEVPAELLQTVGRPELAPVPDTQLLFVKNTSSHILIDVASQEYYALISGRWFRSKGLSAGPWEFVASDKLPADFARIPDSHPKGAVLASVSGTPEAKESVIDNQIPQTASVDRKRAKLKVIYDGKPELKPIEGTSLSYVANTQTPVIRVTPTSYYAVENGVWFVGPGPDGPWMVAAEIPAEIYRIPASSPLYYVTHVRVYGATSDVIYVGYTPGYFGTVFAPGGVVVYGTGYAYPAWVGSLWYPAPLTYGFGAGFAWGAAVGFTVGAINGAAWHGGAWGWGWGGGRAIINNNVQINNFHFNQANIYNRWSNNTVNSRVANRFDGGRIADRAGNIAQHRADRPNDRYAGRDGNVYRRGAQGWERHDGGARWSRAGGDGLAGLDREQLGRFRGESIERMHPGNFGGGGFAGGGGFRGGGGFHGGFRR